jgi:penicillin-binding protein 2
MFGRPSESNALFPIQTKNRYGSVPGRGGSDLAEVMSTGDESPKAFLGSPIPRKRFRVAGALILAVACMFLGRAAQLQVIQGDEFRALAEGNRYRTRILTPARGIVYDRHGEVLIQNVPTFVLTMTAGDLPEDERERSAVLDKVANLAGIQRTELDLLLTKASAYPYEEFPVERGLSYESAMRLAIAVSALPGFHLQTSNTRSYNMSASSLSHVLGYTGMISTEELQDREDLGYRLTDDIGKTGVESGSETALRGVPGKLVVEVDAAGNEIGLVSRQDSISGANVTLALDLDLQKFTENRLAAALEKLHLRRGTVIAIDPQTGGIRAMVSLPAYDSNAFADGIDPETYANLLNDEDQPLFFRAIAGEYPSGSTFKPFIAYAALAEGIVTPSTSFVSTGGLSVGGSFFPDWKAGGHGVTDVRKAIANSVNTYFYIVGGGFGTFTGLGVERITDYAREFGFGSRTGIDLPGEADGFLPSKEWKQEAKGERWYVGDTYHLSIGQGDLLVTPIQLATGLAIIANGGDRVAPHMVEGLDGAGAETYQAPQPAGEPLNKDSVQVVREGMREAVTIGSARFLSSLSVPVAGKTGTAQTGGDRPTHAWFVGFGPYNDPTLAIVVLIEYGGEGSSVAVPIARDMFEWWFTHDGN